jgi:triphosphatase
MAQPDDLVEIEWQFDALDLRPVERWLSMLPTLSLEANEQQTITALAKTPRRLVDSYLDTADWRMAQAGFVLRTRSRGRHDEITLKDTKAAEDNGLRHRLEVTEILPAGGAGALGHDGPVGRRLHAIVGRRPLQQVLEVRTRRRPFALRVGGVDAAEIALDDTLIVVGRGQRPMQLRRVEVEVQPEWVDALEPIVWQLRASCGLQPATLSKFEAGLLAVGAVIPGPPDLGSTDIGPESTMGELAYAVLRRQLAVLRQKEPGTRLGEEPEELHDMRVATRRLRAALDVFVDILPVRARTYRAELGWLATVLGTVRDLDVQQDGLAEMSAAVAEWGASLGQGPSDPLADLGDLLQRERETARADMLVALDSVRWERLVHGLATMVQQGPSRRSLATRLPATISLPGLVVDRHNAVTKAARRAKKSGRPGDFHRLRIRCKRLRYSLEFSSEIYGGRTSRYVRQLTKLQNQLGLMQDAEVAAARLADLATGESHLPASTIFVMGGMAEHHRRDMARFLEVLPKMTSRVGGREWQDLLATMERRRSQAEAVQPPARRVLQSVPAPAGPEREVAREAEPVPRPAPAPALTLTALVPPPAETPPEGTAHGAPTAPVDPTALGGDGPA